MEFSRHARNRLRQYSVTAGAAEALVADDNAIGPDAGGKPRYRGQIGDQEVTIVVALDDPDLIITVYAN